MFLLFIISTRFYNILQCSNKPTPPAHNQGTATVVFVSADVHGFGRKIVGVVLGAAQASAKEIAAKHDYSAEEVSIIPDVETLFPTPEDHSHEEFMASLNSVQAAYLKKLTEGK